VAIAFGAGGGWSADLTTQTSQATTSAYNSLAAADDDRVFAWWVWKNQSVTSSTTSTGWTKLIEYKDGSVAPGNGTGSMTIAVYYTDHFAGQVGLTVNFSAAIGIGTFVLQKWTKAAGETWDTPTAVTANWPSGASWTIPVSTTTTVPNGCVAMNCIGIADDSNLFGRFASSIDTYPTGGITWAGNFVEAPATHKSTTGGNDMSCDVGHRFVTTGGAGLTLSASAQLSAAETGAVVIVVQGVSGGAPPASFVPPVRGPHYDSLIQL
jgi:hypothetical protein